MMVGIGGPDARVVADLAVGQRDVEVDAHEDALAGDVRVADGELVHVRLRLRWRPGQGGRSAATGSRAATNAMRSATRQL